MKVSNVNVLFVGAGTNLLSMFVQVVAVFILTPVILRSLGNYDYGIWEMLGSIVGYMGLMQIGFQPAVSRYTARLNASGTPEQMRELFATALAFLCTIGVLGLVVLVGWAIVYPQALAEHDGDATRYAWVLVIFGLTFAISMAGNVQESMLEGLQLYGWKNMTTIFTRIVSTAVAYYYIESFDPMIFLSVLGLAMLIIKQGIWHFILERARPGVTALSVSSASRSMFMEIFRFSAKTFIQGLGASVEKNSPALVIGWLLGPASVVFYRLPMALIGYMSTFSMHLSHAFMPFFSELHALGQAERMRSIYLRSSKILVSLVFPVGVLAALIGPEFIGRWAGRQYEADTRVILPIIALTQLVPSINPLSSRFLTAANRHGFLAKIALPFALAGVLSGIALAYPFGAAGVAMGALLPMIVKEIMVLRRTCVHLAVTSWGYLRAAFLPLLPAIFCEAAVIVLLKHMVDTNGYPGIFAIAVAAGITYLVVVLMTGYTADERNEILDRFSGFLRPAKSGA